MPTEHANAPSPLRPTAFEWAVLALGLVLVNHHAWLLDDAFIFFRYVDNWVLLDSGLVYNRGEFVEGFTSPAWTLLLAALRSVGLDYWVIVRGVGALSYGLFWWMLVVLARDLAPAPAHGRRFIVDFPLAYLGLNYAVLCYFTSGVEAPLVQLSAVAYALYLVRPERRAAEWVVAASTLVRPELALATALAVAFRAQAERRLPWGLIAKASALVGAWLVFRVVYYAELLPNTFYLKHLADWGQGLVYLNETLLTYGAWAVAALFGLLFVALRRAGVDTDARARLGMLAIALAIALYFVRVGGDPRHYRYLAFSFCLAVCATAGLVEHGLARFAPGRIALPRGRAFVLAATALFALGVAALYPPQLSGHPMFGPVVHTMRDGINDAAYHRQHERLALDPWSSARVSPELPQPMATDDYTQVTNASWCEWAYRLPHMRVIQNLGLTDAILARVDMQPDRPAHKSGLQPMARDLEAVHRLYTAAPGMIRMALDQGHGARWMRENLEQIETIERKIYNRHALFENIGLAFSFPGRITPPEDQGTRRNLVFVVIDTLRWDHVGEYHPNARDLSPALDAFAQRAVRFERAYASAPWTRPSIGSMLTGLHPSRHGGIAVDQPLPDSVETLPEMLRSEGYDTAGVVSNWVISRKNGFAQGFDHYDEAAAAQKHASTSEGVTRAANARLTQLAEDPAPFLLFVHYFDPHYRYLPHPGGRLHAGRGRTHRRASQHLRGARARP